MEKKPIKINVALGYTLNTGDYESLKLHIGVEDEARMLNNDQFETSEQLFNRIYGFVERKLEEKLLEAKEQFNGS